MCVCVTLGAIGRPLRVEIECHATRRPQAKSSSYQAECLHANSDSTLKSSSMTASTRRFCILREYCPDSGVTVLFVDEALTVVGANR